MLNLVKHRYLNWFSFLWCRPYSCNISYRTTSLFVLAMEKARSCVVSLLFLALATYVPTQKYQADLTRILNGLLQEEEFPQRNQLNKVAIGFGSCVDIITEGVELLERLGAEPPEKPFHNNIISSKEQLAQTFAFFFERGSASE